MSSSVRWSAIRALALVVSALSTGLAPAAAWGSLVGAAPRGTRGGDSVAGLWSMAPGSGPVTAQLGRSQQVMRVTPGSSGGEGTAVERAAEGGFSSPPSAAPPSAGTKPVPRPDRVDCNQNSIPDDLEIAAGTAPDCNTNGVPDDCDMTGPGPLYVLSQDGADLSAYDLESGAWTSLGSTSLSLDQVFSLAMQATVGGELYAIVEANSTGHLAVINPLTAETGLRGGTDANLREIDFRDNGVLYALISDIQGSEVVILDPSEATVTHIGVFSSGGGDHAIAFRPGTSLLYKISTDDPWSGAALTGIDVDTGVSSPEVSLTNFYEDLAYDVKGERLIGTWTGLFYAIDPATGEETYLGAKEFGRAGVIYGGIAIGREIRDCNANGMLDECEADCNANGSPDECDVGHTSGDCNHNHVPDECEPPDDCNGNGTQDICDLANGVSRDCNGNGIPDECDGGSDCNNNGTLDECEMVPGEALFAVEPGWGNPPGLFRASPLDGSLTPVAYLGPNVTNAVGLAIHPLTGAAYGIVQQGDPWNSNRWLARVHLATAAVEMIGELSRYLADITFRSDGVLVGVTGNGDSTPGEVVIVDPIDATITTPGIVGSGGGGQCIAARPGTDLLYHLACPEWCRLERIDMSTGQVTLIRSPLSEEFQSLVYSPLDHRLLASRWGDWTALNPFTGAETFLGNSGTTLSGLAFAVALRDCNGNGALDGCDVTQGTSSDCQPNGIPDECENPPAHNCCETGHGPGCNDPAIQACVCAGDPFCCDTDWDGYCTGAVEPRGCGRCVGNHECNGNGLLDECDILHGTSADCQGNGTPDECDLGLPQDHPGLVHRYSFNGNADDSVSGANGVLYGDAHVAGGELVFDEDGDYAELPIGDTIVILGSATLEAWVTWDGGCCWQRIFDIGTDAWNYMFLTPQADGGLPRFGIRTPGTDEQIIEGNVPFPVGVPTHVAVVLWETGHGWLYINGARVGENPDLTLKPVDLGPSTTGYLGQSFFPDPSFSGRISEFRVYTWYLTAAEIAAHAAEGPDAALTGTLECNGNGIPDECDIAQGTSADCQHNGIPDECDLAGTGGPAPPPGDLTELNAAGWLAWSDGGVITLADDTDLKQAGQSSLRIETTGCFDNYVRHPADESARWDLSRVESIRVWFYAVNPNLGFQEYSPRIRLGNDNGYYEWRPAWDILNDARDQWVEFVIPLAGDSVWQRSESGTPSLSHIHYIEVHADTWDCGFTLWMDGLHFEPQPSIGSRDCNGDGTPDECELSVVGQLYGVYPGWGDPPQLYEIDPASGVPTFIGVLSPGITNAVGLSTDPRTGRIYAVVQDQDPWESGRLLAEVDAATGTVTIIGPLSRYLCDIAFRSNGTLYGITGNNDAWPGEIVTVNTSNAAISTPGLFGTYGGAHSIAFHPHTNLLYHTSCPYDCQLEVIDVTTGQLTVINPDSWYEYQSLVYDLSTEQLLGSTWEDWVVIDPATGAEVYAGDSTVVFTGLTFGLTIRDCNNNGVLDECDIAAGTSLDANHNGTPDECDFLQDCNGNSIDDAVDIAVGTSTDCNLNGVPDECETATGHGLAATYYDQPDFSGSSHGRIDPTIDFDWGENDPWPGFDDAFSVRWTGWLRTPNVTGDYVFYPTTDDGVRLWVNGRLIVDQWVVQGSTESWGTIHLQADHVYSLVMEYFDDGGPAVAQLRWEPPGQTKEILPTENLSPGRDCNANDVPDDCDISAGTSTDCNGNGVPDVCEALRTLDLGDVLLGGDGSGTGTVGAGINPRDGRLVAPDVFAGSGGGPAFIALNGSGGTPDFTLVDGVMIPYGNTPVDSQGTQFAFPYTSAGTFDAIRKGVALVNYGPPAVPIRLGDQPGVNRLGIGMHTNSGVTFDLAGVPGRATSGGSASFAAVVGIGEDVTAANVNIEAWVLVDGVQQFHQWLTTSGMRWADVAVDVPAGARFLTLATTDAGNTFADHAVWADARLTLLDTGDCNSNGVIDICDITAGTSRDCNASETPDECEIGPAMTLVGDLSDPENTSVPPYIDIVSARIAQHGKALVFSIQTRGNVPTALPEPDDTLTFLWLIDADRNASTGQPHGTLGSEFNVRAVIGETYGGAFVDVTGDLPGGGIGTWAVTGTTITMSIGLDQIASPALFNWRSDAGGFVTGTGNINNGGETVVVAGATSSLSADCNTNGIPDECDIAAGTSEDINGNDLPDECEVAHDCNHNGTADADDIAAGTSPDCQTNGIPDECETDCNDNGVPDDCDLAQGTSRDCNTNGTPDECDIAQGHVWDCNGNAVPDECDLAGGTSRDCQSNGIPDECELGLRFHPIDFSSQHNGRLQSNDGSFPEGHVTLGGVPFDIPVGGNNYWHSEIAGGDNPRVLNIPVDLFGVHEVHTIINTYWGQPGPTSYAWVEFFGPGGAYYRKDLIGNVDIRDWNQAWWTNSINGTTTINVVQYGGHRLDKQEIVLPAEFQGQSLVTIRLTDNGGSSFQRAFLAGVTVLAGIGSDCNANGIPDACDLTSGTSPDCQLNGTPDECDVAGGTSADCQPEGVPDECQLAANDCNTNSIPDDCEPDCNTNGKPDQCDLSAGTSADGNSNATPDECEVDLELTTCDAPPSVDAGDPLSLTWTVTNIGGRDAASVWGDSVYLSSDDQIGNDTPLQSFEAGPLPAGDDYIRSEMVPIAATLAGDFWIVMATDAGQSVQEVLENNNARVCGPLTINDTLAPQTTITAGSPDGGYVTVPQVTFEFTGSDNHTPVGELLYSTCLAPVSVGCDPLAGPFAADTSVTFSNVTQQGSPYVFEVAARDAAGNIDLSPATRTFTVDWTGVTILSHSPSGSVNTEVCAVQVTFNEPPLGFTQQDVSLTGPSGAIAVTQVVATGDPRVLSFKFACQSEAGLYSFTVGPNIFDPAGNPMAAPYEGSFGIAMPDLAPTELDVPSNGVSGTAIAVSWTIENHGSAPAGGTWKDATYLSNDAVWGNDTLLAEYGFTGPLGVGATYHRVQNVPIPGLLQGEYWIIVVTDSRNNLAEHLEGADNRRISSHPLRLNLLPYPDLEVPEVSGPPNAWPGQQITVCWTVTNNGDGGTGAAAWKDDVYLSLDQVVTPPSWWDPGDTLLGRYDNLSSLAGNGDSYQQCQTVTIPSQALGCYYLLVRTDSLNQVFEYRSGLNADANNDGQTDTCLEVALPPPPDLQVTKVIAPASGWSGQPSSVTWEVTNLGQLPTPGGYWQDTLYLSADQSLDASDTQLGTFGHNGVLAPNGSYEVTRTCNLPRWTEGQFYVFVLTDSGNHVPEQGFEGNNAGYDENTVLTINLTPPPDLEVTALSVSEPTVPDLKVNVSWTVTNKGGSPTEVGSWRDSIYLSADDSFETAADNVLLGGPYPHGGALQPDASYDMAATVTLPQCLEGTYYVLVVTDVQDQVEEFFPAFEENNDRPEELPIALDEADLEVRNVWASTNGSSGQPITVHWEVNNIGAVDSWAASHSDKVYLSADTILDPQDDDLVGTVLHSGSVTTTNGYAETRDLNVPVGVSGDFYILVLVNADGAVVECGVTANNVGYDARGIHVTFTEADLRVTALNVPSNGLSGQPLQLEWTVTNAGQRATDATSWVDAVYLSGYGTPLATFTHNGSLPAGGSYTRAESILVPPQLSGTQTITVCTDFYNVVSEPGAENNNCTGVSLPFVPTEPDLEVFDVNGPVTGTSGDLITVSWSVHNIGERATTESTWVDNVYLSADQTLGGGDVWLGSFTRNGVLPVNGVYSMSKTMTLASNGSGLRYFIVHTDAGSVVYERGREANNVVADPTPIDVLCIEPDLRVASTLGPSTANSGTAIEVTWTVINSGQRQASGAWYDGIYLSDDPDLSPAADTKLGEFSRNVPLAVGATYVRTVGATLPNGISGAHYLYVMTDNRANVLECAGEDNNLSDPPVVVSIGLTLVDLMVESVQASSNGYAGQETTVGWTVLNAGASVTPNTTWRDSVYLSLDPYLDPGSDPFLGYAEHLSPLGPGITYAVQRSFTVPVATPPGDYYVLAWTDSQNDVYEHNAEDNNDLASDYLIQVAEALEADLVVTSITPPFSAAPGQLAAFAWTVANQGVNAALGSWYDSVYLSTDNEWDLDDVLVAKARHDGTVAAAGGSYTASVTATVPGVFPGPNYVIVRCDINNHIPEGEAGEANNIGVSTATTNIQIVALILGVSFDAALPSSGTAHYYQVTVLAEETLVVTLDAQATAGANELYIRFGQIPDRGHYDFAFDRPFLPDQQVTVPTTQAGTYYILVYGNYVPIAPQTYTILAESLPFSITALRPNTGSNTGTVTVEINGARFEPETDFTLVASDDVTVQPVAVYPLNKSTSYAIFDLAGVTVGLADATAVNPDGAETTATEAFEIVSGGGAHLTGQIIAPSRVRAGRAFPVRIEYSNIGTVDMPAPLFELSSRWEVPMGTSADGPFDEIGGLRFLGINMDGPAGILPPTAFGAITLYVYVPDEGYWAHRYLNLGLRWWTGPGLVDWAAEEVRVRPDGVIAGLWAAVWNRLVQHIGPAWSDFEREMGRIATRLWQGGERVYDVRTLFARELDLAWDEYPSWIRGTIIDDATEEPLAGIRIFAVNTNGDDVYSAVSEPDGSIELQVPEASYGLFAEGYNIMPPVTVTLTADLDATGLVLRAVPGVPGNDPTPPIPPEVPDASPALVRDREGNVQMVWNRGGGIWHARFTGTDWDITGSVGGEEPGEPRITQGPIEKGPGAVTVMWQEKNGNDSELTYLAGWPDDMQSNGFAWAAPVQLTQDIYGDQFPAILLTSDGQLMVVWLKRDFSITDDTDLYYDVAPIPVRERSAGEVSPLAPGEFAILMADPEYLMPDGYDSADRSLLGEDDGFGRGPTCITVGGKGTNKTVKMTGPRPFKGDLGFGLEVKACADLNKCTWTGSGSLSGFFVFGEVTSKATGSGKAQYVVERKPEPCDWRFSEASLDWSIQHKAKIEVGPIFVYPGISIPCSYWGIIIILGGGGGFTWQGDSVFPSKGSGSVTVGGGVYGGIDFSKWIPTAKVKLEIGGEVTGTVTVSIPLDLKFRVCLLVYGEAVLGPLKGRLDHSWCSSKADRLPLPSRDYPPGAYVLRYGDHSRDAEPVTQLVFTVEPLLGTGAVYGGQTVLADVTNDLRNDHPASLTGTAAGEALLAWTKDSVAPEQALGSAVLVASYAGSGWSAPTELIGAEDFNFDPQVVLDGAQTPMVVWTHASATGLTVQSTAEDILAAMEVTDLVYARYLGGAWSAPTPLIGSNGLPGRDYKPALAADDTGRVLAAWLHVDPDSGAQTVYAALWEGAGWGVPTPVAPGYEIGNIACAFASEAPLVVWEADPDGDGETTPTDQALFYAVWDGASWSGAQTLPKEGRIATQLREENSSARGTERGLLPTPPKECCACESDAECDDRQFCNGTEKCDPKDPLSDDKGCVEGDWPCDLPELCDEANDTCWDCNVDTHCNDFVDCTTDHCVKHKCQYDPTHSLCDDGQFCNGQEKCSPNSSSADEHGCIPGEDPCPPGSVCHEGADICECASDADCDDGHPCTLDKCDTICYHTPSDDLCPDDGNVCNGPEYCDDEDGCVSGPPLNCDDENECTIDTCNEGGGCVHEQVDCGASNACLLYTCEPGRGRGCKLEPTNCDDGDPCTADSCDPNSGCQHRSVDCEPGPDPVTSGDPNEKIGPSCYGEEGWVAGTQELFYTIRFENVPTAEAAAQVVYITDPLDSNLDWRTFRVRDLGFGDHLVQVTGNLGFFQTDVDLRAEMGLIVRIHAGINVQTGRATWTLTSLDPETGELPTDADLGFLPPNNADHDGEGFVSFTVQAKGTAPTGTVVHNGATIVFDVNEPIDTNVVSNTIDVDPPTSTMTPLPTQADGTEIPLSWSGDDVPGGSGLASFAVYVSVDGGPFQPFLSNTTDTSAVYTGQPGHTYAFYSLARDNAGNIEAVPTEPDATTLVPAGLVAAAPEDQKTLWRRQKNVIILTFNANVAVPTAGQIEIREMLPGGGFGPDLSPNFTFLTKTGDARVLLIKENSRVLGDQKWIEVHNTGGWSGVGRFTLQYRVQVGDVDNNGIVTAADLSAVFPRIPTKFAEPGERTDVDGNGRVTAVDLSPIFPKIPSMPVPKPDGH